MLTTGIDWIYVLKVALGLWAGGGGILWCCTEEYVKNQRKRALYAFICGPAIVILSSISFFWKWMKK